VGRLGQLYLVVIATIAWLAVAVQIFLVIGIVTAAGQPPIVGILNTLSYFTVLTNLLVALVATASAWRGCSDGFLTSPSTITATAVYIFVVGLIYSLVLRALWEPSGLQLAADIALHDLVPTLYVVYWLFCVPKGTLRWDQPIHWLIYPLAYMAYTLVRGLLGGRCLYLRRRERAWLSDSPRQCCNRHWRFFRARLDRRSNRSPDRALAPSRGRADLKLTAD
jgi:hypothetical protein